MALSLPARIADWWAIRAVVEGTPTPVPTIEKEPQGFRDIAPCCRICLRRKCCRGATRLDVV